MTKIEVAPLVTQSAVLHATGLGVQFLLGELREAKDALAERNDRAVTNLAKLDRIHLALYHLADELEARGGKVSAQKLAKRLLEIRDGSR